MCIKKIAAALLLCLSFLDAHAGEKHPSLYRMISKVPKEKVTLIGPQSLQEDYDYLPDRPYGEYSKHWKVMFENLLNCLEEKFGPVNQEQDTLTLIYYSDTRRVCYIADFHGKKVIVDYLWNEPRFCDYVEGLWFNDFWEDGGWASNLGKDCFLNHFFDEDIKALDSFLKANCKRNFQSGMPPETINGVRFYIKDSSVEKVIDTREIKDFSIPIREYHSDYKFPNFFQWPEGYFDHEQVDEIIFPIYKRHTARTIERIRQRYARNKSD